MAAQPYLAGPRFKIRKARKEDIPGMTDAFFKSFNAPFWKTFSPPTQSHTKWWHESFTISLDAPDDRSFVAVDTEANDRIVGFSRWQVPQADGRQERTWPALDPSFWDMELCQWFFGGLEVNRRELMGTRPHWMLELLGVDEEYQGKGIGSSLIKWGTDEADKDGLETYLDASEKGKPWYIKWHAFNGDRPVVVPDRPEYGHL